MLTNISNQRIAYIFSTITLILYLIFVWLYKLGSIPGLHADEAWSGLLADHFINDNTDQISGMNNYTGILQPLINHLCFKIAGIGILQLRISGVVLNLIGVLTIFITISKFNSLRSGVVFLLFVSQSPLLLISPRIAWEVNTFTLIFSAIIVSIISRCISNNFQLSKISVLLFFVVNLMGSYNHIIFSILSLAILLSVAFWTVYFRDYVYKQLIGVLLINFVNVAILFTLLNTNIFNNSPYSFAVMGMLLLVELFIPFTTVGQIIEKLGQKIIWSKMLLTSILLISFLVSCVYHSIALFESFQGSLVFLQVYSYETNSSIYFLLVVCAITTFVHVFIFFDTDLRIKQKCLLPITILICFSLLSLYTTQNSYRYYLMLTILIAIYLSLKFNKGYYLILVFSLLSSFAINVFIISNVFFTEKREVKTLNFKIGNGQKETNGHFLPKEPLISFFKKNHIDKIQYLNSDSYFIEKPIDFYKLFISWKHDSKKKAVIGYNVDTYKSGFTIFQIY